MGNNSSWVWRFIQKETLLQTAKPFYFTFLVLNGSNQHYKDNIILPCKLGNVFFFTRTKAQGRGLNFKNSAVVNTMLHCAHIIKIIILSPITDLSHTPTAPFGTVTLYKMKRQSVCVIYSQLLQPNFECINFLASHDNFYSSNNFNDPFPHRLVGLGWVGL